jgi:hypothetical protein
VERSSMIVASAIHGKTVEQLINGDQVKRVAMYSPMLIESASNLLQDKISVTK